MDFWVAHGLIGGIKSLSVKFWLEKNLTTFNILQNQQGALKLGYMTVGKAPNISEDYGSTFSEY